MLLILQRSMTLDSTLGGMDTITISQWETVKARFFKDYTTWDILVSKVQSQQPDDPVKCISHMFKEVEHILNMFQMVVDNSCSFYNSQGDPLSDQGNFILPEPGVSQFLGVTPYNTRIYIKEDCDPWSLILAGQDTAPPVASEKLVIKDESEVDVKCEPSLPLVVELESTEQLDEDKRKVIQD